FSRRPCLPGIPTVLQRIDGRHVLDYCERAACGKRQYYCLFFVFKLGDTISDFNLTIGIMYTTIGLQTT
ncbi:MAG TPA: hypothetical protein VGO01_09510, partial [Bradyrhizobium sp.]|nr:hypothetical protein [Bradyrhizobium sp.]